MTIKNYSAAILVAVSFFFMHTSLFSQSAPAATEKGEAIKWITFEEAIVLNKKKPKMIFIDFYTDWCGWCKKMDAETFTDPQVVHYINKKYYAVKFNAEQKGTLTFKDQQFINPNPDKSRSTHQLALALLKNEKLYPSYVLLDKASDWTFKLKGYKSADDLLPILNYYGDEHYKKMTWGEYSQLKK